MVDRWDETWHRLLEWTNGQAPSERLGAQILLEEGYKSVDPSHPLGGKDGAKDAVCLRDGERWIMAVYFPRGQQQFATTKNKFLNDLHGVALSDATGIAFVTNQELRLDERKQLRDGAGTVKVDVFHLERITTILDKPSMSTVRKQFLSIDPDDDKLQKEVEVLRKQLETRPLLVIAQHQDGSDEIELCEPPNDPTKIGQDLLNKVKTNDPQCDPTNSGVFAAMQPALMHAHNTRLASYYDDCKNWLDRAIDQALFQATIVPLKLELRNDGNSPATDVRAVLEFPNGIVPIVVSHVQLEDPPVRPVAPQYGAAFGLNRRQPDPEPLEDLVLVSESLKDFSLNKAVKPTIEGNRARFRIAKIQHAESITLLLYAQLKGDTIPVEFEISCTSRCDQLSDSTNKVLFRIKHVSSPLDELFD
jgi:hypothetical protein